jgi:glycosyltransferase involved in cell wall biosynthesis
LRRVLIITYYWPPSGGSAVLRWLKFTKYLGGFGWEPAIYTPLNPEPQEIDESMNSDIPPNIRVIKKRIFEPYSIYKFITGKKQDERLGVALMDQGKKKSFMNRLSIWIRSNLFIPDPRVFWVKPSVRFLSDYLKKHPFEAIITTGPPHSMHLIGLELKTKTGIRWIADFRDPWTKIDFYAQLSLTERSDQRHRYLEKKVLNNADHIITVSPGMTEEFRATGINNVTTITNGYDSETIHPNSSSDRLFTLVHLGSMPKTRNPGNFWKAVADLINDRSDLKESIKIRLIGKIDFEVKQSIKVNQLDDYVSLEPYIPHAETLNVLASASVLLLFINNSENAKGILTNKFFEYLSAKRPVIGIGPTDGDAAYILNEAEAGRMFEYDDHSGLKSYLSELFDLYSQNLLNVEPRNIEKYSRRNLAMQLSELLNSIVK